MPVTINGDGSIAGLSVGGLGSGVVNTATLADGAITSSALPAGSVIQVKSTVKKDAQTISGAGGGSAGTDVNITGLSFSITPSSSSSLILLQGHISHYVDDNQQMCFTLKANGSLITDAIGDAGNSSQKRIFVSGNSNQSFTGEWQVSTTTFSYRHAPATTSAVTYQVCYNMGTTNGTSYINRSERDGGYTNYDYRAISTFTGMEIAA